MFDPLNEPPESTECTGTRTAREKQSWRNAVARRKLEARRERQRLRQQLTNVWDEPISHQ
jgi:hypothetical protein